MHCSSKTSLSARRAWIEIIDYIIDYVNDASLSARRAWIEIPHRQEIRPGQRSLSARRAWIEILKRASNPSTRKSLSARRAWIEISTAERYSAPLRVALRKESVDRNWKTLVKFPPGNVALRKESVDRNIVYTLAVFSASCRSPQGERG